MAHTGVRADTPCPAIDYFTPCINRTVGLIRIARATAATILNTATDPNSVGRGIELYNDAALPASQLPMLVEDIVDTGFTLRYLLQTLAGRAPNSLSVCTFLDRNSRRIVQVPVDFRCFEIPDRFVVGFGLDFNQLYRNLHYVAVMKHEKG